MKVTVIGVGRLKEKYWQLAIDEYSKRLGKYIKLNIIEVADEKAPENLSVAEAQIVKKSEGEKDTKKYKKRYVRYCTCHRRKNAYLRGAFRLS